MDHNGAEVGVLINGHTLGLATLTGLGVCELISSGSYVFLR